MYDGTSCPVQPVTFLRTENLSGVCLVRSTSTLGRHVSVAFSGTYVTDVMYTAPRTPSANPFGNEEFDGNLVIMNRVQIAMARQIGGWPLYTIIIALGQVRFLTPDSHSSSHVLFCKMLAANSYQMTLLTGQNYQDDLQLYVLSAVFLASSFVWYTMFRLKPSVYVLSAPWLFYGIAFFLIGVPSLSTKLQSTHTILSDIATWSYAVASAAAFIFFGLNFGEEAVRPFLRPCCYTADFASLGCRH